MKRALLILIGCVPFLLGWLLNASMMADPDTLPPLFLLGLAFLIVWGILAFFARPHFQSGKEVVLLLNLAAAIDLLLIAVQELFLGAYWMTALGAWTQFFYLPVLNFGFTLTTWSSSVFMAYLGCFVLMVAVSVLGCCLRKEKIHENPR